MRGCAIVHVGSVRWSYGANALLWVALLGFSGADAFAAHTAPDQGPLPAGPSSTVRVTLLVDGEVSKPALRIMRAEADRIWARYAVAIEWLTPEQAAGTAPDLVALVGLDSRSCRPPTRKGGHTLGCFQKAREGSGVPMIVVFHRRATQMMLAWLTRFGARAPAGWLEWRTGTLLGRVLAHEVGHYLLGPGHSATGLMREKFEFQDLWADSPDGYSVVDVSPNALR